MTAPQLIWILEDEPGCQFIYREILEPRFQVRFFDTLAAFNSAIDDQTDMVPKAVVADVRLPDGSFLTWLSTHGWKEDDRCPLVVVSSVDDSDSMRMCFQLGAQDYLTKPFGKSELLVKVERLLNREPSKKEDFDVDPTAMTVSREGRRSVALTTKEFQILALLSRADGGVLPKSEILGRIWNQVNVNPKTLDVHLFHLRRKLQPVGIEILFTPPNLYKLVCQPLDGAPATTPSADDSAEPT